MSTGEGNHGEERDGIEAEDVHAMWRVLLLVSMDPDASEQTIRAAAGQHSPERSARTLWSSVWEALPRGVEPTEVAVLPLDMLGPDPHAVVAVGEFVRGLPSRLRQVALAVFVAGLDVSQVMDAAELGADEFRAVCRTVEAEATHRGLLPPDEWSGAVRDFAVPFDVDDVLGLRRQHWLSSLTVPAAAVAVVAVLLALAWPSSAPEQVLPVGDDSASSPSTDRADASRENCLASSIAADMRVSPVYQRRLEASSLVDAVVSADVIVTGRVTSVRSNAGELDVEMGSVRLISGAAPQTPSSFRLAGRHDPNTSGSAIEVVAFLRQDDAGWVVSESGGLWASCPGIAQPVAATWSTGEGWPADAELDALVDAVEAVSVENRFVELVAHGDGASGGFRLNDGRLVLVDTALGAVGETLSVALDPNEATLALVRSPSFTAVLAGKSCRATPDTDCSTATVDIDVVSSDDAVAPAVDIHVLTESAVLGDSGVAIVRSRDGVVRVIDVAARTVRWSVEAGADARLLSGSGEIAVIETDLVRVFDAVSGVEHWRSGLDSAADAVVHDGGWLLLEAGQTLRLRSFDGLGETVWSREMAAVSARLTGVRNGVVVVEMRGAVERTWTGVDVKSGELRWSTDVFALLGDAEDSRALDLDRGLLVTLEAGGAVSLVDLASGQVRWSSQVSNAQAIVGIWTNTLTVTTSSGRNVKLGLADGFILPP